MQYQGKLSRFIYKGKECQGVLFFEQQGKRIQQGHTFYFAYGGKVIKVIEHSPYTGIRSTARLCACPKCKLGEYPTVDGSMVTFP